ncbi:MAG: hypothetical protein P8141_14740 [Gammaproteobacteria bacterium]
MRHNGHHDLVDQRLPENGWQMLVPAAHARPTPIGKDRAAEPMATKYRGRTAYSGFSRGNS